MFKPVSITARVKTKSASSAGLVIKVSIKAVKKVMFSTL
jgi:hypothetical protein